MTCPALARLRDPSGRDVLRRCARLRWHWGRHTYKGASW